MNAVGKKEGSNTTRHSSQLKWNVIKFANNITFELNEYFNFEYLVINNSHLYLLLRLY